MGLGKTNATTQIAHRQSTTLSAKPTKQRSKCFKTKEVVSERQRDLMAELSAKTRSRLAMTPIRLGIVSTEFFSRDESFQRQL